MLQHLWINLRKTYRTGTKSFRKRVGTINYKHKPKYTKSHKRPGTIDVQTKDQLYKLRTKEAAQKIRELEIKSGRIFGKWNNHAKFNFDFSKVPKFQIPDLTDFKLKPYVSYQTPKVTLQLKQQISDLYDYKKQHQLLEEEQVKN